MRAIDHFAADGKHASVGLCLECGNDGLGMAYLVPRRREGGVDHPDLVRMNGELAGVAFASCRLGFALQSFRIAKIGEYAIDRLDPGRDGAGEAQRTRELGGKSELAVVVLF